MDFQKKEKKTSKFKTCPKCKMKSILMICPCGYPLYKTIFFKKTKNPKTGKWEQAQYLDNYFGKHNYGVKFSDGKIYPESAVKNG